MPQRKQLRRTLERLHEEIEETDFVDANDEKLLRELMADITRVLDASAERREVEEESIGERLSEAIQRFEKSHPTLAANIERVIDAFGRLAV